MFFIFLRYVFLMSWNPFLFGQFSFFLANLCMRWVGKNSWPLAQSFIYKFLAQAYLPSTTLDHIAFRDHVVWTDCASSFTLLLGYEVCDLEAVVLKLSVNSQTFLNSQCSHSWTRLNFHFPTVSAWRIISSCFDVTIESSLWPWKWELTKQSHPKVHLLVYRPHINCIIQVFQKKT